MLIVAAMSTSAYLLLFAFLSVGCAQDESRNTQMQDVPTSDSGSTPLTIIQALPKKPAYNGRGRRPSAVKTLCPIPPQPANGVRTLRFCKGDVVDCDLDKDVELPPDTVLMYTCDTGYRVDKNPLVLCKDETKWSPIPACIEVKCDPLNSTSLDAKCFRLGRWVDCDSSLLQGTQAKLSCRSGYSHDMSSTTIRNETVECNKDGKWEPDPIECEPVCGAATTGTSTGFPWHASVYNGSDLGDSEMRYLCEATVIRNDLVLTAASCVWNSTVDGPLESVFVLTGHSFQNWNHPLHDPKIVRKSEVKYIHVNCDYRGNNNSVADIALLELEEPLEYSTTFLPACLNDHSRGDEEVLEPDEYGTIAEFGKGAQSHESIENHIIYMKTVPYLPHSQCATLDERTYRDQPLTSDKFCADYFNRSTVCIYNRGGGLMFKKNDLWHVMGVVSELEPGCGNYTLFTNVSQYTAWIQKVMFNLDHYKYHPSCDTTRSGIRVNTANKPSTINNTLPNYGDPFCLAPPQPVNGEWRSQQSHCPDEANCTILEGAPLISGTQLTYTCAAGYVAKGRTEVYCGISGNWSAIPHCTEIKCDPLNSVARKALCFNRFNKWVSCDFPVLPGTRAEISCHLGYRPETAFSTFQREVTQCTERGDWTPNPVRCVPVCGVATTHQTPFIFNGTPAKLSDFPWHATLYMRTNFWASTEKKFICGATIIQTNFVLTAAHCVYDETTRTTVDPEKLFVVTGNILRDYDSPRHNPFSVRKTTVTNVYTPCKYHGLRGNYASDIALLELQSPFQFSSILLPACLDVESFSDQILEPGAYGKVAGFGRTETGESSGVLQTLTLPYIAYNECEKSENADRNEVIISEDKFCAGYTNGSAVCEGDSGGGLVFRKNELWYVLGIVSVGLGVDIDKGEKTCDRYSYSLYTKVSEYMTWIQDVMLQRAQGNPYPPCDADVRSYETPRPLSIK